MGLKLLLMLSYFIYSLDIFVPSNTQYCEQNKRLTYRQWFRCYVISLGLCVLTTKTVCVFFLIERCCLHPKRAIKVKSSPADVGNIFHLKSQSGSQAKQRRKCLMEKVYCHASIYYKVIYYKRFFKDFAKCIY